MATDFSIFDEAFYLQSNPDVNAAVKAGAFKTGLEHFQRYGLAEGRAIVSPEYSENFYLAANPEAQAAVTAGTYRTGLQEFINIGSVFGRDTTPFETELYLQSNPDVALALSSGAISSALGHYLAFGQREGRAAAFTGTSGDDEVTGMGDGSILAGIDFSEGIPVGTGIGQRDILIGGAGSNTFVLGVNGNPLGGGAQTLYVGAGAADFATIKGFNPAEDTIQLAGELSDYTLRTSTGSTSISLGNDLIGIVEGYTAALVEVDTAGTFLLGRAAIAG